MESLAASKSRLFLLELILSILIFSVASVVCVRLFVKARSLSDTASDLKMAVLQADSAAQSVRAAGGDFDSLLAFFPEAQSEASQLLVGYDEGWNFCPPDRAQYRMILTLTQEDRLLSATIVVESDKTPEPLYSVTVRYTIPLSAPGGGTP